MQAPDSSIHATPAVSVVLPVLNEEKDIEQLLEDLLSQNEPPGSFEVLVADGGSTDKTREIVTAIASRDSRARWVSNPGVRSSAGRNAGAREARGAYVLFLDGHCKLPGPDYLVRLVEIFQSTGAACLCRPQPLQDLAEGKWAQAIAAARHSWLGHNPGSDIYADKAGFTDPRSAGAAYERRVLLGLGGYDERFDACEDVEFNHRVARSGLRAYVHPDLRVHYRPRNSLRGLYRQMHRYGRGRAHLMARHGVVPLPLLAVTLALGMIPLLGLLGGWRLAGTVAGLGALLWVTAVIVESLRRAGPSLRAVRVTAVFPVLYAGLFMGFWRGVLEMRRFRAPGRRALTEPITSCCVAKETEDMP